MGENNRPAGWGQNKNIPDSWGKGGSASPWGQKQDKPAGWGSNNSSPDWREKETVPPVTPSKQETVVTEQPETAVNQEPVEPVGTISLIKEEASVQADETVIPDENDYEAPEPIEASLPNEPQDIEPKGAEIDFAEPEPEPEIMSPPVAPPPAPQNPRPVQQQIPQRPQYRPPEPPRPAYQQPYRNDSDYGYVPYPQSEKKSRTGVILGSIIAVLLLIIGIFIGLFVLKKNDSNDSSSTLAPAVVTDAATTSATTTTVDNSTSVSTEFNAENTTTTTSQMTTTTAASYQIKRYPASDINNYPQYLNYIDDIKKEINDSLWASDFGDELYYELIDINNDNIPELFVSNVIGSKFFLYSIVDNKATFIYSATSMHGNTLYEDGTIVLSYHDATTINNAYIKYYGGYSVEKINESDVVLGNYVELRPTKLCDLKTNSTDAYNDTSNLWGIGKVTTESTVLNLREEPSTSADIIAQIPKDSYIGLIGISTINNDWYYVKYYKDTSSPIYYGYVHRDYVTITQWYD